MGEARANRAHRVYRAPLGVSRLRYGLLTLYGRHTCPLADRTFPITRSFFFPLFLLHTFIKARETATVYMYTHHRRHSGFMIGNASNAYLPRLQSRDAGGLNLLPTLRPSPELIYGSPDTRAEYSSEWTSSCVPPNKAPGVREFYPRRKNLLRGRFRREIDARDTLGATNTLPPSFDFCVGHTTKPFIRRATHTCVPLCVRWIFLHFAGRHVALVFTLKAFEKLGPDTPFAMLRLHETVYEVREQRTSEIGWSR